MHRISPPKLHTISEDGGGNMVLWSCFPAYNTGKIHIIAQRMSGKNIQTVLIICYFIRVYYT